MQIKTKGILLLCFQILFIFALPLTAGTIDFSSTESDVKTAVKTFVTVAALIVGVVGFGRAAWKFSQGENDAIQSLLAALVANGIAMIAQSFK
mgnify:CR=1 FL=1